VRLPLLSDRLSSGDHAPIHAEPSPEDRRAGGKARHIERVKPRSVRRVRKEDPEAEPIDEPRPRTRADCRGAVRPCPWISCRHHVGVEVHASGNLSWAHPGVAVEDLEHSCALDLAEHSGLTLAQVGNVLGITRERVRQIEHRALAKVHQHMRDLGLTDEDLQPLFRVEGRTP
jgi:hypothetical protein